MVVVPEMIGSIVGVYNGKTYNQVEIKVTQLATAFSVNITCQIFHDLLSVLVAEKVLITSSCLL